MNLNKYQVPYYNDLIKIRTWFENNVSNFPNGSCRYISHVTKKYLQDYNLILKKGYIKRNTLLHTMLYDESRDLFVDLSLDQFVDFNDKISIFKSSENNFYSVRDEESLEENNFYIDKNSLKAIKFSELVNRTVIRIKKD